MLKLELLSDGKNSSNYVKKIISKKPEVRLSINNLSATWTHEKHFVSSLSMILQLTNSH